MLKFFVSAGVMALLLSACDRAEPTPAAGADGPQAAAALPLAPPPVQDRAVVAATPQVSLSEEDRQRFRALVRNQLDGATAHLQSEGYVAAGGYEDEIVAMQPTESHDWPVTLRRGVIHRIVGGCDAECTNLDFELIDAAGRTIEADTLPDDYPIINVTPPQDGRYTLRIVMKACKIAPCYAGARVLQRGPARGKGVPA